MDDARKENWEALANAVVEQAAKDYLKALRYLKSWSNAVLRGKTFSRAQIKHRSATIEQAFSCEVFFRKYCSFYTGVDGQWLRDKLVEASGMNRAILDELMHKYQEEGLNYESET